MWFYDFISDKLLIIGLNSIYDRPDVPNRVKILNKFILPSFAANADMNTTAKMRNIQTSVNISGSDLISYGGKYSTVQFTPELMVYSLDVTEQKQYSDSTNNKHNTDIISLNKPTPTHITKNGELRYDREFPKSFHVGPGARVEDMFRFADIIQFDTDGEIDRAVGDVIHLTSVVDTDTTSPMKRFNGEWVISRLTSSIHNGEYTDSIIAVRADMNKGSF
jgi:hypothetical protein